MFGHEYGQNPHPQKSQSPKKGIHAGLATKLAKYRYSLLKSLSLLKLCPSFPLK